MTIQEIKNKYFDAAKEFESYMFDRGVVNLDDLTTIFDIAIIGFMFDYFDKKGLFVCISQEINFSDIEAPEFYFMGEVHHSINGYRESIIVDGETRDECHARAFEKCFELRDKQLMKGQ